MTEKFVFADVNVPFHVWVKEGSRWVLRDAAKGLEKASPGSRADAATSSGQRKRSLPRS